MRKVTLPTHFCEEELDMTFVAVNCAERVFDSVSIWFLYFGRPPVLSSSIVIGASISWVCLEKLNFRRRKLSS